MLQTQKQAQKELFNTYARRMRLCLTPPNFKTKKSKIPKSELADNHHPMKSYK
jgi:hypothetical protein